jgi:hypothetical protein
MATDAKAILSHPRSDDLQLSSILSWLRHSGPFVFLGLGAFVYASLMLSGLRLFDNDYDWINQAQDTDVLALLGEILRPIPDRWGFQDRPVQILAMKLLHGIGGETPAIYYTFKAALFATVSYGIARISLTLGLKAPTALLAGSIFALSSPGQASALWVSDIELLAEILILAAFGCFWRLSNSIPASRRSEWLNQALFVMIAIVAHRTKGSAKLIPAIVLVYLFLYRRDQIRRFLPSLALIVLTIVPVFEVISNPVPPFAPFAEDQSQGWMWKPANTSTLATLIAGNFHPIWGTAGPDIAFSLLSVLSPALLWPAVCGLGFLFVRERKFFSKPEVGFVCIWATVTAASYASFPRLPEGFMVRYVVVGLVPVSIGIAVILVRATSGLRSRILIPALTCILALHGAHNLKSTRHLRDTLGQVIVAYDLAREYIAHNLTHAEVLIIGFHYGYNRRIADSNAYHDQLLQIHERDLARTLHVLVRIDQDLNAIEHQTTIQEIRKSIKLPVVEGRFRVKVRPVETFPGLTDSFYDKHIYGSTQSFAGVLYEVTFDREQA